MVLTYSSFLPDVRKKILKRKRHDLEQSENLRKIFHMDPMVAYKRGSNLRDVLVHQKTKRAMFGRGERGREDCKKNCVICQKTYGGEGKEKVEGPNGKCTYDGTIGCRSSNIIYGIWCAKCQTVCYVGETGDTLYTRAQNHLSSIRVPNPTICLPVRLHFREDGHSIDDAWVVGLERVWERNVEYRRAREKRWIGLLGTGRMAGGMNKKCK